MTNTHDMGAFHARFRKAATAAEQPNADHRGQQFLTFLPAPLEDDTLEWKTIRKSGEVCVECHYRNSATNAKTLVATWKLGEDWMAVHD